MMSESPGGGGSGLQRDSGLYRIYSWSTGFGFLRLMLYVLEKLKNRAV